MESKKKSHPIRFKFDERKAAAAAAFLLQLEGGKMDYIRLIKLLYLAERQSLTYLGRPIVGDTYYALDHGPILSRVLDLIKRERNRSGPWTAIIERDNYVVCLKGEPDLGPLADVELEILKEAHEFYRAHDKWHLRDITHDLPEWRRPPSGSRIEILPEQILQAVGKKRDEIEEILKNAKEKAHFDRLFGV